MADREIDSTDPLIARVRDTLSPMPRVDASDVARMLVAVHGRRRSRWERIVERFWFMRIPSVSTLGAASLAVLALTIGFMSRDLHHRQRAAACSSGRAECDRRARGAHPVRGERGERELSYAGG